MHYRSIYVGGSMRLQLPFFEERKRENPSHVLSLVGHTRVCTRFVLYCEIEKQLRICEVVTVEERLCVGRVPGTDKSYLYWDPIEFI